MSTSVQPSTQTNESRPNETSPSPVASGGTVAATSEFRYGTDAPQWAQGKTAAEVLGIAEQLNGVVRNYVQSGAPQQPVPVQQTGANPYTNQYGQYVPPVQQTPAIQDDAYLTGADISRVAPRLINDAVAPQFEALYGSVAQSNLDIVRRNYSSIFDKYGPEVNSWIAKVPVNQRTVDNLTTIVDIVRGKHADDLASEIASQRIAGLGAELRSNGSPTPLAATQEPKNTLQSGEIPQDWKDRAAKAGLTESAVDEFCRANDISREQFFSQFGNTAITEVTRG